MNKKQHKNTWQRRLRYSVGAVALACYSLPYAQAEAPAKHSFGLEFHLHPKTVSALQEQYPQMDTVQLTIHEGLQAIAEEELTRGLQTYRSKRGCIIVLDTKTGDILAMAGRRQFNPDAPEAANTAVTYEDIEIAAQRMYEPGSIFQVVAATCNLEQNGSIFQLVNCAPFTIGNGCIKDKVDYDILPMWGVIAKSSKPGIARVGLQVKPNQFDKYLSLYGLKEKAVAELHGHSGLMNRIEQTSIRARMTYGYGISLTPMHIASIYASIANDGVRKTPRIIKKVMAADGQELGAPTAQAEVKVMSPRTAQHLRYALEAATRRAKQNGAVGAGTATAAAIPGYRLGGKAGTSCKVMTNGQYGSEFIVSFAGILPIDRPQLVIMTMLDAPQAQDGIVSGDTMAAAVFRATAERIIKTLNIQPSPATTN